MQISRNDRRRTSQAQFSLLLALMFLLIIAYFFVFSRVLWWIARGA